MSIERPAVIIVHYFNWPAIADTIADFVNISNIPTNRIYVVDNGSPEEANPGIEELYPGIRIISGHGNIGYAGAVNLGAQQAYAETDASHLVISTHEVRIAPDTLSRLQSAVSEEGVGAAGPILYRKRNKNEVWSMGGDLPRSLLPRNRQTWSSAEADWIDGCLFVVDSNAFFDLGGMYEPYFLYLEEVDFFTRMRQQGLRVLVIEGAVAFQEPGKMPFDLAVRNRILLASRIGRRPAAWGLIGTGTIKAVLEMATLGGSRHRRGRQRMTSIVNAVKLIGWPGKA